MLMANDTPGLAFPATHVAVAAAMVEAGVRANPGAVAYRVRLNDGSRVLAKVVGRDQPDADWLYRAWRPLAFREPDDQEAIVSPAQGQITRCVPPSSATSQRVPSTRFSR